MNRTCYRTGFPTRTPFPSPTYIVLYNTYEIYAFVLGVSDGTRTHMIFRYKRICNPPRSQFRHTHINKLLGERGDRGESNQAHYNLFPSFLPTSE
jgi:hypothetical protein